MSYMKQLMVAVVLCYCFTSTVKSNGHVGMYSNAHVGMVS